MPKATNKKTSSARKSTQARNFDTFSGSNSASTASYSGMDSGMNSRMNSGMDSGMNSGSSFGRSGFDRQELLEQIKRLASNPAVRQIAGGIATVALAKLLDNISTKYPQMANLLRENMGTIEGKINEYKQGGSLAN